ncbi:zinc finger SWIM domain-containing protein 7 isoform X1 [Seriola lalandi dorsalis]|uniref:zinc finger SWIM domain-containing protein 7 isoform X1 n=1 Tax=Seriola lalandi dorsalis TaxID=1841481 RepID=UPI000C6F70D2|nr:zinc finger SWIM domain-containing protein 7 isoform X1 [Seriola lalandi dorsalis]XP_056253716.1 zinc finger SWIM domain-containing protein 7 isoform X1 [Seriola aureovittata]
MPSLLPAVAEQLFRDIQKTYQETSQSKTRAVNVPDDLLIALKFVFGPCALQALDLVDQRSVTCLSSPSGRKAFQVMGGSGRLYTCFVSCHYCPCPAFAYTVLRRNEGLLCKHVLAAYLCQALGVTQEESVSDQQMSKLLSGTAAP